MKYMTGAVLISMTLSITACQAADQKKESTAKPEPITETVTKAEVHTSQFDVATSIQPGHYATEGGWGQLIVKGEPGSEQTFQLDTDNLNSGCSFAGTLTQDTAIAKNAEAHLQCEMKFSLVNEGVDVLGKTIESCRNFCGGNGSYESVYIMLNTICQQDAIEKTKAEFKMLYDEKDYAAAEKKLAPVVNGCLTTMDFREEGALRNDYALTQHKLGQNAACLTTLEHYAHDAARTDDEIMEGMAPVMVDDYLAIIKAARTNLKLCKK